MQIGRRAGYHEHDGATDSRRLEVVGLPLFGESQFAMDTVMVPFTEAQLTPMAWSSSGQEAHRVAVPELVGPGSRACLVVLALEVGGRWSPETRTFVAQLAKVKARREPLLQKRAEQAWRMRWCAILSCAAGKVVATCLLGFRCAHGADGDTPLSWEVEADHRHAGLAA